MLRRNDALNELAKRLLERKPRNTVSDQPGSRTYTAAGSTASMRGWTLNYGANGRLMDAKKSQTQALYTYNGRGERVRKLVGSKYFTQTDAKFTYDEAGRLLAEFDARTNRWRWYVWMDDLPVGVVDQSVVVGGANKLRYVYSDHLGTPRAVKEPATGTVLWRWTLEGSAFGSHLPTSASDSEGVRFDLNLRYPGQYYDSESGLHYNYFRDYDPSTGRYIESDPIGLRGGVNTYGYVGGSPLVYVDRNGLYRGLMNEYQPALNLCRLFGINCDKPRGPPTANYHGAEGHFFAGGGFTAVNCVDECGNERTFRYFKVCFGAAAGASVSGGLVTKMSGKNCRSDNLRRLVL
ncbi:RHS repeat-associated core domain-containing protein [Pseudomarimonas arenosa]|uniref:RHS repeat-associated core domain-containing protein n=1 Tax=Pseudomarimonas arenosa TaxID=2774145 RepID=A0AAW3ZNI9_9GAMM|nr:RHS repeat-associated core domain-containing protein [Pseudomarimonas arenosa]MBD8526737.1 RHS repeat-associated core domain-containing protein [Pseudomarimonas arenosa]